MVEFLHVESSKAVEVLRDVVVWMTEEFAISRAEAVARVNAFFSSRLQLLNGRLLTHEEPYYWAMRAYYDDVPDWGADVDRSQWVPISAPPPDSEFWTIGR